MQVAKIALFALATAYRIRRVKFYYAGVGRPGLIAVTLNIGVGNFLVVI